MIKQLSVLALKLQGWRFDVKLPPELRSFVFIGVPHTSNYDFLPAMAVAQVMGRNAKFVIKNEWTRFPLGLFMKPLGALGLDRKLLGTGAQSNTDAMAVLFKRHPELVLMIAPEGTRKANSNWKSGFYYVAQKAQVPIVLGFADYERKLVGTGPIIQPKDFDRDMTQIMEFYRQIKGKFPENFQTDARFPES